VFLSCLFVFRRVFHFLVLCVFNPM
jgi:hypothetical protein